MFEVGNSSQFAGVFGASLPVWGWFWLCAGTCLCRCVLVGLVVDFDDVGALWGGEAAPFGDAGEGACVVVDEGFWAGSVAAGWD